MKAIQRCAAAAALALMAGAVPAQPASGAGPGASAPMMGPGGMRGGPMGGRWGRDYTPGWGMMTAQERQEHQAKMRSMTNYDECKGYMDQHHQLMVQRAKDKGVTMPAQPRRDACAPLKR